MGLGVLLVPLGVPRLALVDERGRRRDTAPEALTTQRAECALRHGAPTAVFGRRMALECLGDAFRLRRSNGCLKRGLGVGMQMVHPEAHLPPVGRMWRNPVFCYRVPTLLVCAAQCLWDAVDLFMVQTPSNWLPFHASSTLGPTAVACQAPRGEAHALPPAAGSTWHPPTRGAPAGQTVFDR
jgi:hypothetical protein